MASAMKTLHKIQAAEFSRPAGKRGFVVYLPSRFASLSEMTATPLLQLLQGPFNFLRPDMEEVRRLVPEVERALPMPRPIYLEDEGSTPIHGFPILQSAGMDALRKSLAQFILAEENAQLAAARRDTFDRKSYAMAWERYCGLLAKAVENST